MVGEAVSVVFLAKYRRDKKPKPEPAYLYFCLKCDGSSFKLSADGSVVCANPVCKALMSNLFVYGPEPAA
jgi:hypothetical protein